MTSLKEIRENGIGNGFKVVNPEDGYRKDNRLWFGNCSLCGERVTNSSRNGVWEHSIVTVHSYHANGNPCHSSSRNVDYCPNEYES